MARGRQDAEPAAPPSRLRLDKWLVHARFVKTRGRAADLAADGHVRLNGQRLTEGDRPVRVGDVLTLALPGLTRVVEVLDLGERRGPASEARLLYRDLSPPAASTSPETGPKSA